MDRNGAVAPGVWEGAGSCSGRCSHGHSPDRACVVLTQPLEQKGSTNVHRGWKDA